MSRIKTLMVAFSALMVLGAVVAAASSASWNVGGAELAGEETLKPLPTVKDLLLRSPGVSFVASCTSIHIINGKILGKTDLFHADKLIFLGCVTLTPAKCEIEGTTIETGKVLGLIIKGTKRGRIRPSTGKLFTNIPFKETNTCVFTGEIPVKGEVTGALPNIETENKDQLLEGLGSVENNSLEIGSGNKAFLNGQIFNLVESGSAWSFT